MISKPKAAIALTVGLGIVGSAALYMQAGGSAETPAPRVAAITPVAPAAPEPMPVALDAEAVTTETAPTPVPIIAPMNAPVAPTLPMPGAARPERLAQADAPEIVTDQALSPFGLPCGLTVTTEARPAAMVALDIMDPCQGNARVVVEHSGLNLTGTTDVDAPMLAEIYTFPRDTLNGDGTVRLSIEAEVTEANCGQDTLARTLESDEEGAVAVIELTFTVPGCDAVGDYLVLQNLLQDLRVATN